MINFSFIIPHKDTPELLKTALTSIPRRKDVEIIVVDDNSNPSIVNFDHFPGLNEERIKVIFTKGGHGAGYARNIGLEAATGRWVFFCDADDFYTNNINLFLDKYGDIEADVVFWMATSLDIETGEPANREENINEYLIEGLDSGNFDNLLLISCPYKGMYFRHFLLEHNIRFNKSRWGNDVVFSTKVAVAAKTVIASELVVYCITRHRSFGLMSKPSLESSLVRFHQEAESIRIARKKFNNNPNIHKWFFDTWFAVYKRSKFQAIKVLPTAIFSDKLRFIKGVFKAL